jgi:hypothetical protein
MLITVAKHDDGNEFRLGMSSEGLPSTQAQLPQAGNATTQTPLFLADIAVEAFDLQQNLLPYPQDMHLPRRPN